MICEAEETIPFETSRGTRIDDLKNTLEQILSATEASAPPLYIPRDLWSGADMRIVLHDPPGMSHYDDPFREYASHARWRIYQDAADLTQTFPDRNWTELDVESASEREESSITSPLWVDEIIQQAGEILNLPENWNSYGARRIDEHNVTFAINKVLLPHVFARTPKPDLVPTSRGGIMLEWHIFGIDLEIEIDSPKSIHISFEDSKAGEEWEVEVPSQYLDILNSVIARLTP